MVNKKAEFAIFVVIFAVLAFVCSNLITEIKLSNVPYREGGMIFLLDCLSLLLAGAAAYGLYMLYFHLFIEGYVKKIKKAIDDNNMEKAEKMKAVALECQPNKTPALMVKYKI